MTFAPTVRTLASMHDIPAVIALGSTSPLKEWAACSALVRLGRDGTEVVLVDLPSERAAQPVGRRQTTAYAEARAVGALRKVPHAPMALGVESGISKHGDAWTDEAVVVVVCRDRGVVATTTSVGLAVPDRCVMRVLERGVQGFTVGDAVAELYGGDPTDPHATLTGERLSRRELLADAVYAALVQASVVLDA